ncbi:NAD(P)-dependent oxidoreductase [Mitsuaria sp. PDC51]|uniref:NAD(P)-dependent oxidoreductase n=1 Tax=Mitsuaria sp. PDC51 TaxID=1881035 RepID=UPI000B840F91|nr:NAD(P)-dependent oxidoreductase [Mitsuaria sp. PDC51]
MPAPTSSRRKLLVLMPTAEEHLAQFRQRYDVIYAPTAEARAQAVAGQGAEIELVVTIGAVGLRADEMAAMPRLGAVAAQGAGYEAIDLTAARARGLTLWNGAGTNDSCVADHAMALLLASVRALPQQEGALRAGLWRDALPLRPSVNGRKLGILGLGTIGLRIAKRALAFDMEVGYHNRRERHDALGSRYFDSALALAGWADFLIVAAPGGPATRHIVNAEVLKALGPQGHVVNIARGSLVDTAALAAALAAGELGGAALDVYESEPKPPEALLGFPNVILTPHIAGWSPESVQATVDLFLENARRWEAGEAVLTPL